MIEVLPISDNESKPKLHCPVVFEDYLVHRMNYLDQKTMEYCKAISGNYNIEWDAHIMGEILDYACNKLNENHIDTCYPYYEEEDIPCPDTGSCNCKTCTFKELNTKFEDKAND